MRSKVAAVVFVLFFFSLLYIALIILLQQRRRRRRSIRTARVLLLLLRRQLFRFRLSSANRFYSTYTTCKYSSCVAACAVLTVVDRGARCYSTREPACNRRANTRVRPCAQTGRSGMVLKHHDNIIINGNNNKITTIVIL